MAVVTDFVISVCERFAAIMTYGSIVELCLLVCSKWWHSQVIIDHFTDVCAFLHDVILEFRHDVFPAVHSGFRPVFWMFRNAIAGKAADTVFVDNSGGG